MGKVARIVMVVFDVRHSHVQARNVMVPKQQG
jgi:hypothetical protein